MIPCLSVFSAHSPSWLSKEVLILLVLWLMPEIRLSASLPQFFIDQILRRSLRGPHSVMVSIRRNWKRPAQLPHTVRMQAKMADPIRPSNGDPLTVILGNQSRVQSHTDHQTQHSQAKINQVHGIHLDLASAESGGADKLEKPAPREVDSEEKSSLQTHQMGDMHGFSRPNQENIFPGGKVCVLIWINPFGLTHCVS